MVALCKGAYGTGPWLSGGSAASVMPRSLLPGRDALRTSSCDGSFPEVDGGFEWEVERA